MLPVLNDYNILYKPADKATVEHPSVWCTFPYGLEIPGRLLPVIHVDDDQSSFQGNITLRPRCTCVNAEDDAPHRLSPASGGDFRQLPIHQVRDAGPHRDIGIPYHPVLETYQLSCSFYAHSRRLENEIIEGTSSFTSR